MDSPGTAYRTGEFMSSFRVCNGPKSKDMEFEYRNCPPDICG